MQRSGEVSSSVGYHLPSTWFSWFESLRTFCVHPEGEKEEWFPPAPFMQQMTTELSHRCRAVVLKVGFPDQHHEYHLGTGEKCKFLGSTPDPESDTPLGVGPGTVYFNKPRGFSPALGPYHSGHRVTQTSPGVLHSE